MRAIGRKVEIALEKGNWPEALEWKQRQLLNQLQLKYSMDWEKKWGMFDRKMGRWAKAEGVIPGMDPAVSAVLRRVYPRHGEECEAGYGGVGPVSSAVPREVGAGLAGYCQWGWYTDSRRPSRPPHLRGRTILTPFPPPLWTEAQAVMNMLNALGKWGSELGTVERGGEED